MEVRAVQMVGRGPQRGLASHAWKTRESGHGLQGWAQLGGGHRRQGLMDDSQRAEAESRAHLPGHARGLSTLTHPTSISRSQSAGTAPHRTSGWNRDTPEQVAVGPGFRRGECLLLSALLSQTWSFVPFGKPT